MKQLTLDCDLCVGCCRCVDFVPAFFDMKNGKAIITKQPEQGELAYANNAIENCPQEAIFWKDEDASR